MMKKSCCNDDSILDKNQKKNTSTIALIGNPNSGKTTLFNILTGSSQRTGNWPGVTVERKEGQFEYQQQTHLVVDLPGTYSLELGKASLDEEVTRQYVLNHPHAFYINIIDASTIERGLYLTLQLREQGVSQLVLLNMMDVADKRGMKIDLEQLEKELGCPVIAVSLKNKQTLERLYQAIDQYHDQVSQNPLDIAYDSALESAFKDDISRHDLINQLHDGKQPELRQKIEQESNETLDFLLADGRFQAATNLAQKIVKNQGKISRTFSDKMDRWVLGRYTGLPIFLLMMYLLFLFSINIGGALVDFFDLFTQAILVDGASHLLTSWHFPTWLTAILANGLGGGIQVVATFIPIIGALYLFLTILEESGYMSRAAFVMDLYMRKLGISGKAFVPLIVGFGCNVPGIMAARTLDSQRERIMTVMMAPFMSCGARLAVYALFAAAFFPVGGQNIVFLLYLIGIFFAIMTAFILKKTLLQGETDSFLMELPTYQMPQLQNVLTNTWNKLKGFIVGAGQIIVLVVMFINVVNSLGTDGSFGNENSHDSVLSATARVVTPVFEPMGIHADNWPATVGIISGLLAKEVVVGTLDSLYSQMDEPPSSPTDDDQFNLKEDIIAAFQTIPVNLKDALANVLDPLGIGAIGQDTSIEAAAASQDVDASTFGAMISRFDGKIGAFAYLLFILLYFPCVSATGAMAQEVGVAWTLVGVTWSTGLAYASAVIFYQLATFNQHPVAALGWVGLMLSLFSLVIYTFYRVGQNAPQATVKVKFS